MKASLRDSVLLMLAASVVWGASSLAPGAAHAFTPYRLLVEAVRTPQKPLAFVQDKRLKMNVRKALLIAEPKTALSVSSYVAGGHAYLVGWVDDDAQRNSLEDAARKVPGLLSIAVYLPSKPTGDDAPSTTSELTLTAKVKAAIMQRSRIEKTNVAVNVLGTHAVLVGVVHSTDDIQSAVAAASGTEGISGVTNFLHVPMDKDRKPSLGLLR